MLQSSHAVLPTCPEHPFLPLLRAEFEALDNNPFQQCPFQQFTFLSGNIYIYDLVEQCNLSGSCSVANLLGYRTDHTAVTEPLELASLIHPDDLNRVSEHFQRFTTLHHKEVISLEYRMRQADGRWCWLRSQETPLVQANNGFPRQILGMIQLMDRQEKVT